MSYKDTETLLNKYSKPYVNGECRSSRYEKQLQQDKVLNERLDLADQLFNELPSTLILKPYQKNMVKELILIYRDFRLLCRKKVEDETMILAFIFYVKKQEDNDTQIEKYKITRKYGLSHHIFEIILCNLILNYLKEVYIIPRQTTDKNHEILMKG